MEPTKSITIGRSTIELFYWNGERVVYVDNRKVEGSFDEAVKDVMQEYYFSLTWDLAHEEKRRREVEVLLERARHALDVYATGHPCVSAIDAYFVSHTTPTR